MNARPERTTVIPMPCAATSPEHLPATVGLASAAMASIAKVRWSLGCHSAERYLLAHIAMASIVSFSET